jgi:hypothetical protein
VILSSRRTNEGRIFAFALTGLMALGGLLLLPRATRAQDAAKPLQLLRPLNGATVRETVPIRARSADLPKDGYVVVSIDGTFRTARILPIDSDLLYLWDTQTPFTDPNDPGTPKYSSDGTHVVTLEVRDKQSNLISSASVTVHLANKVAALPDGVRLSYDWKQDETLRYKQHTELSQDNSTSGGPPVSIETSDVRFQRSVEDATGGQDFLIRDLVFPDGFITNHGTQSLIQSSYLLKSGYRTVNDSGQVISEETPFSPGDHFSLPLPEFPARRVSIGDSWQTHVQTSLTWASVKPTVLTGTAKLEGFEWQNGYPTAKITETYDGQADFYIDARAASAPVTATAVHLTRTIWFAYNSKRLIRMQTQMTAEANLTTEQAAALGGSSSATIPSNGPAGNPYDQNGGASVLPQPYSGSSGGTNGTFGGVPSTATTTTTKFQVMDDTSLIAS